MKKRPKIKDMTEKEKELYKKAIQKALDTFGKDELNDDIKEFDELILKEYFLLTEQNQ
jgi:hypothetical protein